MQIQPIRQNIYIKNQRKKNVDKSTQPHSTLPSYGLINYPNYFNFKAKAPRFKEFRQVMENGSQKAFNECKAQIEKLKNPKDKAKKAIAFIAGLGTTLAYDTAFSNYNDTPESKNLMELFEIASICPNELVKTMLKRYKLITEESIPDYADKKMDYREAGFTRASYGVGCVEELDYNQINKIFSKEPELLTDLYLGTKDGFGIMHLLNFIGGYKYSNQALVGFYNIIKSSPELVNRLDKEIDNYYCRYCLIDDTPIVRLHNYIKYSQFVQKTPAETDKDQEAKNLALNFTCEYVEENPDKFMEDAKKVLDWNPDVLNGFLNTKAADGGAWPRYNSDGLIRDNILKPDSYNKLFKNHLTLLIDQISYRPTFEYLIENHKDVLNDLLKIVEEKPQELGLYLKKLDLSYFCNFSFRRYLENGELNHNYGKNFTFDLIKIAAKSKNLMNAEDMEEIFDLVYKIHNSSFKAFNEPFDSNGDSLLFKILDIKADDKKSNDALDRIFKGLSRKYIDLDVKDGLGFSFLEKAIYFENERGVKLWKDSNPSGEVNYTRELDLAINSCKDKVFKNYVLKNLDCQFADLKEAVKLCSLTALKKLESQFESPLYTEDKARNLWYTALNTCDRKFCVNFFKQYEKYLPARAIDDLI